jgi:hypothetical protein
MTLSSETFSSLSILILRLNFRCPSIPLGLLHSHGSAIHQPADDESTRWSQFDMTRAPLELEESKPRVPADETIAD